MQEEKAKDAAVPADKGKKAEKKNEGGGGEKKEEAPPAPLHEEVVMRVFMHCEGCARKVKKILKGFDGNRPCSLCCCPLCRCVPGMVYCFVFEQEVFLAVGLIFVGHRTLIAVFLI